VKVREIMVSKYPNKIKTLPVFEGSFNAYKLEAKNSDVLFASYPAGTSIPIHKHDTDNYGIVIRGELILTMNGEVSRISMSHWYHIPANVEHSAKFEVETDEIEFWFHENK
jgi:quercetin dioxygenase-like cupin family protein